MEKNNHLAGQRVHAAIAILGAVYFLAHLIFGTRLMDGGPPLMGLLTAVTVIVALGNLLVAVPIWVLSAVSLLRGPKALVSLPAPVDDAALPEVIIQVPGRNEPLELVMRSIDSVLDADYPVDKLRVQFIDNSDDDRWREVEEFYAQQRRVRVEHRDGTLGFKGGNLNIGLHRLGHFEDPSQVLIGLLDVGDTFAPEVIRPMATEFVHDAKMGFVQDMFRVGNRDETIISWSDGYVGDAARRFTEGYMAHYGLPTMNGHCALLRLQALEDVGRWNESRVAEDWNTGITMLSRGWHGKWVDYEPTNPSMVSTELVPGDIHAQQKQKRRWATGGTELAKLHLWEWMRSDLPWSQRMSLFIRLGANLSVLPGFLVQLLIPVWLAMALWGEGSTELLTFGLVSSLLQNPFIIAAAAAAINYAREGDHKTALLLLLAYPIQTLWRLPLVPHAGAGIAEGLSKGLKEFVITPKRPERFTIRNLLSAQRLVLAVSIGSLFPLAGLVLIRPEHTAPLLAAALAFPVLTIGALFLVPLTQWLRQRRPGRART